MINLIVNADDFGINEVVTAEIEKQIEQGTVSSTTVMANGACLDEVKRFAALHPDVSFGIHLCLSEFDSVTKSEAMHRAGLTDEEGRFVRMAIFRLKNLDEMNVRRAIYDELNAQIDVVSGLGFPISHADSHHHVHTIYPLREVFAEVLHERGIKKLRLGGDFRSWRMKAHIWKWLYRIRLNRFYHECFTTTDSFMSYREFMRDGISLKDGKTIELMCHPGHPAKKYCDEMKMVEAKVALQDNVEMISYNNLY
jgi:predicted glycoside hydrolase/deacetylase ChbG (UPF0249 family)